MKKALTIGIAAFLALVLAVILVLFSLDFNRFKPQIIQAVKQASGLDLTIHGDIDIGFGLDLRVVVHDIGIRNAPWGSRAEMVRVKRCEMNLALLRLIRGVLEIEQLFFIEPDFLLETNSAGDYNIQAASSSGVPSPAPASSSSEIPLLPVKEVHVEKGLFTYRDGRTGETFTKEVNHLVASTSDMQSPIHIELQGFLNDMPVRVEGTFGSPARLVDSKQAWPFEITARIDGSTAAVRGTISDVVRLRGLTLEIRAEGPSFSRILDLAYIHAPFDAGPFALNAVITDADAGLALKDLHLRTGTSDSLEVTMSGAVADLLSLQGFQIDYRIQCKDLTKLRGFPDISWPVSEPIALSGRITDPSPKIIGLSPIQLTSAGIQIITGSAQLDWTVERPRARVELEISKDLGTALGFGPADSAWAGILGRMGPCFLKSTIADPLARPSIEEFDFRAGNDASVALKVTGSAKDPLAFQGMQLFYELRGKDAAELETLLGRPVPLKGPFAVSGRIVDASKGALTMDPLEVVLGGNRLSGIVELDSEEEEPRLNAKLSTQGLNLGPVLKTGTAQPELLRALSALGPMETAFTLSDLAGHPAVNQGSAVMGTDRMARVTIEGSIHDLLAWKGIDLAIRAEGEDAARLENVFGHHIPLSGPFSVTGRAGDPEPGHYRIENISLVLGKTKVSGWIESKPLHDHLSIAAELSSPSMNLENLSGIGTAQVETLERLGSWYLKTRITAHTDRISVDAVQAVLGTRDLVEIGVTGTIHDLVAWQGVELRCSLKGTDPAPLAGLAGVPLPPIGNFTLDARLVDPQAKRWKVRDLQAHFGKNDLVGSLDLDLTEKKPNLQAEISSQELDLRPFFAKSKKAEAETDQNKKSRDKVFPSDPLPFGKLETLNSKVTLKAGQILLPSLALNRVSSDLTLKDGHLEMHRFQCGIGGGTVDGRFDLSTEGENPSVALDLKAERVDIGAMLDDMGLKKYITGTLGAEINVQAQGNSISTLMSGLNGRVVSTERAGRIHSRYIDMLGSGLLREMFRLVNPFSEKEDSSELNCAVHVFDIKDGVANCRTWLADTRYTLLSGKGEVDLKGEKLDLLFALSPKKGLGISGVAEVDVSLPGVARSFRLEGTLAKPSLTINPGGAARTIGKMLGGFTLLGPLGLAAGIFDLRVGQNDPCGAVLKALEDGTYDSIVPATDQSPPPPPNALSEEHQGH